MKLKGTSRPHGRAPRAFTLPEVLVASAILLVVVSGVISTHLFGMQLFEFTKAKLGASDEARKAVAQLSMEIRSAKMVKVGFGDAERFEEIQPNLPQEGEALQIYPTTNLQSFIRYYWDPYTASLMRVASVGRSAVAVAHSISNNLVFAAEDYRGTVLTNNRNNRVIALRLEFSQLTSPDIDIGPGSFFDYYQLRSKITRRALE